MKTVWGERLRAENVLGEYPRPQMKRGGATILNGWWDYAITDSDRAPGTWDGQILVPFSPEAALSGVGRVLQPGEYLWYKRELNIALEAGQRLLLHFGAVDQVAAVYVNSKPVGGHTGGYTAFTLDVTAHITGQDTLMVRVKDDSDATPMSHGKQSLKPSGIWYTAQSGIWQTVWAEVVPERYIQSLHITPRFDDAAVDITVQAAGEWPCAVEFAGEVFAGQANRTITVPVPNFLAWSPERPQLYDFAATLETDRVESYFAMRKVEVRADEEGVRRIFLNGRPYFMHGLLDQGYWPDGLYTAPSDEALILDIQSMKDMGFNMLRKHIKVEPMRWYYHCDRIGMLVWQDMPSGGDRPYRPDVAVPVLTHYKDHNYDTFHREKEWGRKHYYQELEEMVRQLYSVPSIVLWVPFNEGWGQFDAAQAVERIQQLDPTRLIDHASGWHDQGIGPFQSLHVYFKKYKFHPDKKGRAVILSEYGGYQLRIEGHCWNDKNFGYNAQKDSEGLTRSLQKLMTEEILPAREKGLAAAVYTQVSDVEDENNGLWTYDRKVQKIPTQAIREVNLMVTAGNGQG